MKQIILPMTLVLALCAGARAQVNSGSNGSDGAFNPTTSTTINMADHTNGIYQYTSVNIPGGVQVTFIPNANNSPVTWLVQSNVVINGVVDVSGQPGNGSIAGPGGWRGGNGGNIPSSGFGPGGGGPGNGGLAGGGSFGSYGGVICPTCGASGQVYGNAFLLPLMGGSGGGGSAVIYNGYGGVAGGAGGGAILIAASKIQLNDSIRANGATINNGAGAGSGGGVRLVAVNFDGSGSINVNGGGGETPGGSGRIRIDALQNTFSGSFFGVVSQGFQPIIIPVAGQGVQLSIASVAGASVSSTPNGQLVSPDALIPGQQANPITIVVRCTNLPLNTPVTVTVRPANGASVSALGYNTTGTLASSTATVSLVMPRGGGLIYATAATGN